MPAMPGQGRTARPDAVRPSQGAPCMSSTTPQYATGIQRLGTAETRLARQPLLALWRPALCPPHNYRICNRSQDIACSLHSTWYILWYKIAGTQGQPGRQAAVKGGKQG